MSNICRCRRVRTLRTPEGGPVIHYRNTTENIHYTLRQNLLAKYSLGFFDQILVHCNRGSNEPILTSISFCIQSFFLFYFLLVFVKIPPSIYFIKINKKEINKTPNENRIFYSLLKDMILYFLSEQHSKY